MTFPVRQTAKSLIPLSRTLRGCLLTLLLLVPFAIFLLLVANSASIDTDQAIQGRSESESLHALLKPEGYSRIRSAFDTRADSAAQRASDAGSLRVARNALSTGESRAAIQRLLAHQVQASGATLGAAGGEGEEGTEDGSTDDGSSGDDSGSFAAFAAGEAVQGSGRAFRPGLPWLDTRGRPIEAHGGSVLFVRERRRWFWYGEDKDGETYLLPGSLARVDFRGISCYSSADLTSWRPHGLCLRPNASDPSHPLHPSQVAERPRVLRHAASGRFVMWFHSDDAMYGAASIGLAVSSRPEGPFEFVGRFRPYGHESRDFTLFQDEDGSAFVFFASETNQVLHVAGLAGDLLGVEGPFVRRLVGQAREAPAVFKFEQRYFLVSSACTGWSPNRALLHSAAHPMGEWTPQGHLCPSGSDVAAIAAHTTIPLRSLGESLLASSDACGVTFGAQATAVLRFPPRVFLPPTLFPPSFNPQQPPLLPPNLFLLLADRWRPSNLSQSRYVWLPLLLLPGDGEEGEGKGDGERERENQERRGREKAKGGAGGDGSKDGERRRLGPQEQREGGGNVTRGGMRAVVLWQDEWRLSDFAVPQRGGRRLGAEGGA